MTVAKKGCSIKEIYPLVYHLSLGQVLGRRSAILVNPDPQSLQMLAVKMG
jgi:hypothetical protein